MKKIAMRSVNLSVALFALLLASNGWSQETNVVGSWDAVVHQFAYMEIPGQGTQTIKYDNNIRYDFAADGVFTQQDLQGSGATMQGTWKHKPKKQKVSVDIKEGIIALWPFMLQSQGMEGSIELESYYFYAWTKSNGKLVFRTRYRGIVHVTSPVAMDVPVKAGNDGCADPFAPELEVRSYEQELVQSILEGYKSKF